MDRPKWSSRYSCRSWSGSGIPGPWDHFRNRSQSRSFREAFRYPKKNGGKEGAYDGDPRRVDEGSVVAPCAGN